MTEENRRRHRLTRAQRKKVRPRAVWFIEDLLLTGEEQVWDLASNYKELMDGGAKGRG